MVNQPVPQVDRYVDFAIGKSDGDKTQVKKSAVSSAREAKPSMKYKEMVRRLFASADSE
jgi:hypothetical protein